MSDGLRLVLFWAPRGVTILFILFLGLFALDVFGEGQGFWSTLLALLIHLVPNLIVLAILILAWRWEWIGAVLFAALGVFYIVLAWDRGSLTSYLIISGPLFLVALLFLLGWALRSQIRM